MECGIEDGAEIINEAGLVEDGANHTSISVAKAIDNQVCGGHMSSALDIRVGKNVCWLNVLLTREEKEYLIRRAFGYPSR
jgi:hypothetical protein